MTQTYAIADLHGRFDLLEEAIRIVMEHADQPGTLVTLGDYIDRGPESRQIIERLMAGLSGGWRLVCLKGNHEDMMVETLSAPLHPSWWIGNGGGATLLSYGHDPDGDYQPSVVPAEHIAWLDNLPLVHVDKHRVFVHASVDPTIPLDEQSEQTLLWNLYPDGFSLGHSDRHVVHGHHQFEDGPILTVGRTNLDTFAWSTGRLAIGVFDDDIPGGPDEILWAVKEPSRLYAD